MAVKVTGRVIRLYVNVHGTFITLAVDSPRPKDNYYRLRLDHPNYNALYSLALAAAANRWQLEVRITGEGEEISSDKEAIVSYMVVDWEAGLSDS